MGARRHRILFLLKHRDYLYTDESSGCYSYGHLCSGLYNSARLVADMLEHELGHIVKLVQVRDNNCIDREVTKFRPDICIIEAYWVVPDKFRILHRLHPTVKWVVRNHSAMPFAALEGVVIEWSLRYMDFTNVVLACNDYRTDHEFRNLVRLYKPRWTEPELRQRVHLLPNYYPPKAQPGKHEPKPGILNVACFGAIRPLKNHLIQAVAAIEYAARHRKHLRFHVNATRIEQMGHPVLKNLCALFRLIPRAELVEHRWLKRDEFLKLCAKMDIGLHVSMSETFSIGTADLVTHGCPVVTSSEVPWAAPVYYAQPGNSQDIVRVMELALRCPATNIRHNLRGLRRFSEASKAIWAEFCQMDA